MAMTEEQGSAVLSRISDGESVKSILRSLTVSRSDFSTWRRENLFAFRAAMKAGKPAKSSLTRSQKLKKLRMNKARAQERLSGIDMKIAEVEAEDE